MRPHIRVNAQYGIKYYMPCRTTSCTHDAVPGLRVVHVALGLLAKEADEVADAQEVAHRGDDGEERPLDDDDDDDDNDDLGRACLRRGSRPTLVIFAGYFRLNRRCLPPRQMPALSVRRGEMFPSIAAAVSVRRTVSAAIVRDSGRQIGAKLFRHSPFRHQTRTAQRDRQRYFDGRTPVTMLGCCLRQSMRSLFVVGTVAKLSSTQRRFRLLTSSADDTTIQ